MLRTRLALLGVATAAAILIAGGNDNRQSVNVAIASSASVPFDTNEAAKLALQLQHAFDTDDSGLLRDIVARFKKFPGDSHLFIGDWGGGVGDGALLPLTDPNVAAMFAGTPIEVTGIGFRDDCGAFPPPFDHCPTYGVITRGWAGKIVPEFIYYGGEGPPFQFQSDVAIFVFWSSGWGTESNFFGMYLESGFTRIAEPPQAVALVHGYDHNNSNETCGMGGLQAWLTDDDNTDDVWAYVECLEYRTAPGVAKGAKKLRTLVNGMDVSNVNIVTHSMGGLVARYYIERLDGGHRDRVRSLTMLAPPNLGTPVAIAPCLYFAVWKFDEGACDLVPFSGLLSYLNKSPGSHAGVDYLVIAGIIGPPGILSVPNDCVVEVGSAAGLGFPLQLKAVSHVGPGLPQSLIGCVGTGIMDSASVRSEIAQVLAGSTGASSISSVSGSVPTIPPVDDSKPSTIFSASGAIAGNETLDIDVPLAGGLPTATFVFRSPIEDGVTISHSLIAPGGLSVSFATSDVSIDEGTGFGAMTEARYTVSDPAPGIWRLRVVGEEAPAGGWPFELQVLTTDSISLEAVIAPGRTAVGEPVEVTAHLSESGQPLAGATVSARVVKPDGSSLEIALDETEAGVYEGELTDTTMCGVYQVVVRAAGDGSTDAFDRESRGLAIIGVDGDRNLDPCVADGRMAGDVECDDDLDTADVLSVLLGIGQLAPSPNCLGEVGDVNCDGVIDGLDALLILRRVAHLPGYLLVCP